MKSWTLLSLLGSAFAVFHLADAACNLDGGSFTKPFPDVEKLGIESYQINAEYTVPGAKQTDYYTEYYDILNRRGRVDSHQNGKTMTYVYRAKTWEAWEITNAKCKLQNITDTPDMFKDLQTDWLYLPGGQNELRTIGPSSMFKTAFRAWNASSKARKMAYMGKYEGKVRGQAAYFWRRCDGDRYIDYFFSTEVEDNAFNMKGKNGIPLRVFFGPSKEGVDEEISIQQYEILVFRPFIKLDIRPFDLPVARGCRRGNVEDRPDLPDFMNKNLMFSAEVIYRKIDSSGDGTQYWSYYSTLRMALDVGSQFVSYYYTPWVTSSSTDEEPDVLPQERVIYDMKHGYAYKTSMADNKCQIIREKTFVPKYDLPNGAGSIPLTDVSILYPNNELNYLSKGTNRGLLVNIFEEEVEGFVLDKGDKTVQIPKAVITHSYLANDEIEARGSVRNALAQVQFRFTGREEKVTEVLTFNFFGFSTVLRGRRYRFNIQNCYKNEEDYAWATIVFSADNVTLDKLKFNIPSVRSQVLNAIKGESELNAMRIPVVEVDFKDDGLYTTLMILGKPPVLLDFLDPEDGKTLTGTSEGDELKDPETCANNCLEEQNNCWAFSICGTVCNYGTSTLDLEKDTLKTVGEVANKAGCKLYRRYDNSTFIKSREGVVKDLRNEVSNKRINLVLEGTDEKRYQLAATSISIAEPDEDDRIFDHLGNNLNPRMRRLRAGYKLKKTAGTAVQNLGRLGYDKCQLVCLDFKECETMSFCLKNNECLLTGTLGDDLKPGDMEEDNMCTIVTRNYVDNFVRSPGVVLSLTAQDVLDVRSDEACARACLTQTKYQCLSFDHCQGAGISECRLHTVHYPNAKTREAIQTKYTNCGHYFRKFSTEFKKNPEKRTIGSKVPPLSNLTLEECSKSCVEYGKGTCYGFDFCQDKTILATSCILLDSDPSQMKSTYSPICTNFFRTNPQSAPKAYSTGYAGGIGFLCFLVGAIVGAVVVFGIAYFKVNRR